MCYISLDYKWKSRLVSFFLKTLCFFDAFLLFLKNLAATWATCKSHFIINTETGILRVFQTSNDYIVSDKHLDDKGWSQCKVLVLFFLS